MKRLFLASFLLINSAFAQSTSFMTQSKQPLKFQTIDGKLWCANSVVGFRILIEKIDLGPDVDGSLFKIKNLLIRNMKTSAVAAYVLNRTDLLNSDETYVRTTNTPGFPKLFMKVFPHAATQYYIVDNYEVRLNHGVPEEIHSELVDVDFQYTEYQILPQGYFGREVQGKRLLLQCGNWDIQKNHGYDPNPFN